MPYRDWIVGVGLDSDEKDNPPVKFKDVYERARAEGYKLTMHCDHLQENSVKHTRQCLDVIGVDRIDHAYHVLDDEGMIEDVRRRQVCLTFCTTATPRQCRAPAGYGVEEGAGTGAECYGEYG